jgi:hypothetical protein
LFRLATAPSTDRRTIHGLHLLSRACGSRTGPGSRKKTRVRLPFPERVPLMPVVGFALVLCAVQVYQGTAPPFSLCCFLFVVVAAIAFNVAGGITRPSGSYIFFFAFLAVIVGLTWKAIIGEPADSNLRNPMLTIEVYLCSISGMLGAAYISRRLSTKRALLANFVTDENMQSATTGCLITGVLLIFVFAVLPLGTGSVGSGLVQLNRFLLLAIFLGTVHTIRRSGGTRSISLPVLIAGGVMFLNGVVGFSKEGMLTPFLCWLVAASSQRYKVSISQIAAGILLTLFIFQYLVPYSQYGRNLATSSTASNIDVAISLLADLGTVRREYAKTQVVDDEDELARGYFTNHQGFFDRLQMIGPDDQLIELTEQGIVPGITPIYLYFGNLVPHFIWKNKPNWGGGNLYAHQMGFLSEDDDTTGISFSPAGEAFHLMRWTGVFILAPVLWIMLFTLFDSLCGDVRKSPWGLLAIINFAHIAPEGSLGALIYVMGYGAITLIFAAFTVTYLMPILGELLIGPHRKTARFIDPLKTPPGVRPLEPPAGTPPAGAVV